MKVLFAASECAPIVKVGGLGDVIGSLPKALKKLGVGVRVVIPMYKEVRGGKWEVGQGSEKGGMGKSKTSHFPLQKPTSHFTHLTSHNSYSVNFGDRREEVKVYETLIPNSDVPLYLLENQNYLSYGGVYFSPTAFASTQEEIDRFAFFSKAVVSLVLGPATLTQGSPEQDPSTEAIWSPDIIHCHDWHTSLIPQLLRNQKLKTQNSKLKTILTIHNLANQGFSKLDVIKKLGMQIEKSRLLSWDAADDNIDFILQGIVGADFITTVSPTYAKEILTPRFGEGLHDILKAREGRVAGILNGIDYEVWDPARDPFINFKFQISNFKIGKKANKQALQKRLGLKADPQTVLIGMVSRLTGQKGFDLVLEVFSEILNLDCQLVILGVGEQKLEKALKAKEEKEGVSVNIKFDERLAHQIYAGADLFLMPSRFEPCGLPQMISMKYGTLPIVRSVGGLKDTVEDKVTGFVFAEYDAQKMLKTLKEAIRQFDDKESWAKMVKNAMSKDFSWENSASEYLKLYERAIKG